MNTPLTDDFILHDLKLSVQFIVAYPEIKYKYLSITYNRGKNVCGSQSFLEIFQSFILTVDWFNCFCHIFCHKF